MKEFEPFLYGGISLIVTWMEFHNGMKILRSRKAIQDTRTSDVGLVYTKSATDVFEFSAPALATGLAAPISQANCAWWHFEVAQVKVGRRGSSGSAPILIQHADFKWILFDANNEILAIKIKADSCNFLRTFKWT